MTALAALIRKNLHLGLAGDRKGMQNTLDLMRASNLLEAEKAVDPAKNELSADDAAVLQEYLTRQTRVKTMSTLSFFKFLSCTRRTASGSHSLDLRILVGATKMNDLSPSLQRLFRAAVRQDIRAFLYRVFLTLEPGSGFIPEWYIDAVLYQLERVRRGEIRRLIINLAPRSLKSS